MINKNKLCVHGIHECEICALADRMDDCRAAVLQLCSYIEEIAQGDEYDKDNLLQLSRQVKEYAEGDLRYAINYQKLLEQTAQRIRLADYARARANALCTRRGGTPETSESN